MDMHLNPELQAKVEQLAAETGRSTDELVEEAISGYFDGLAQTRQMLDSRYDDIKSGREKPVDGEAFFESLQRREHDLIKQRSPK